jgi:DNA-binding NarL/FixJ family response regulator
MSIRVYIVEDHDVMRDALVDFIESTEGLEVCGYAASAEEALPDLFEKHANVAVLDLSLPGRSGFELLEEIQTAAAIPCLVLSGHSERAHVERALAAGAKGYLRKGFPEQLAEAITIVAAGGSYVAGESWSTTEAPKS